MEAAAVKIVEYLYQEMTDSESGEKSFCLVRLFKTHDYGELSEELKAFVRGVLGREPSSTTTKCLTLLATAGRKPEWNDRKTSQGHRSIPLDTEEMVRAFPMISNLVSQLGLEITDVLHPDPNMIMDLDQKAYNVFHVFNAAGHEAIVDQQNFVVPEGVKSCLGFGGMLPSGNLFVVVMFATVPIPPAVAAMFRTIALNLKLALLGLESAVFAD